MNPFEMIELIESKEQFIDFLNSLSADSIENSNEWENNSIENYLESIAAWVDSYSSCPRNDIDWDKVDYKLIAKLFYVGKIYE